MYEKAKEFNCFLIVRSLQLQVIFSQDMDPELRQKADLERSRNKQRQRLRASGKRTDASPMEVSTKDRKAWRKAQNEIEALLDPFSATLKRRCDCFFIQLVVKQYL